MTDVGELIAGRYRLVERIAAGGMGVVWEGWDELLARRVAVKQVRLQPGLSEADTLLARNRVIREARITARLHHPHAVTIYDVVDDGDYPCLIMQFVPSSSLTGLLHDRGTLPPSQVGRIGADLAAALQAAHAVGIVHRDVKPGNVLITEDGSAKLTDFGISHAAGDVTLTSTGMVSGTPAYLAPEVARGGASDFPADVFSLGATLYSSMEGTPPFGLDPNPMAILYRVASGRMIPPRRSGSLTPLLLHMMAPEPADRPTMSEVSRTLAMPVIDAPVVRPSPPPAGLVGGSAGLVGAPAEPPVDSVAAQTVPVSRADLPARNADPHPTAVQPAAPVFSEPRTPRSRTPESVTPVSGTPESGTPEFGTPGSVTPESVTPGPSALAALMNPTSTGTSGPIEAPARRRRTGVVIGVAAAVLAVALTAGFLLVNDDDGGQGTVAATSVQDQAAAPQLSPSSSPSPVSAQQSPTPETQPATSAAPDPAVQLAAAVTDYYALMPGNTDAGWTQLTGNFQTSIARNRESYNSFWGGVDRVVASDVTSTAPGTVEATITYYFTDGSVSVERTSYQLVQEADGYKIDSSTVLSSRAG